MCRLKWSLGSLFNIYIIIVLRFWSIVLWTQMSFEILKSNHDNCYIILTLPIHAVLENSLNSKASKFMHLQRRFWISLPIAPGYGKLFTSLNLLFGYLTRLPNAFSNVIITHFVKNAVGPQHDKVMLFTNLKWSNFWFCLHNIWVAASELQFCLWISKCPTNW